VTDVAPLAPGLHNAPMRRAVLILLVLAGCVKAPPKKKHEEAPPLPPREQVLKLLETAYAAIEAADGDKLKPLFAADVTAFGLGPSELYTDRDTLIEKVSQQLLPIGLRGDKVHVVESHAQAALAKGELSGWVWDLPKIEHERRGESTVWQPRITAHVVRDFDGWRIDALHVSVGVPDAKLWAADGARRFVPPADVKDDRGPDSEQLIGLTKRLLEDVAVKVERISDAGEVLLVGTDPGELFIGGKRFKDLVRPSLPAIKKSGYSTKLEGPLRSRLADDKKTGWVAANVVLRRTVGKKAQEATPFRVLWLFAEENGVWNLVSEHQSLALKEEQREPATDEEQKNLTATLAVSKPAEPPPAKDKPGKSEKSDKDEPIKPW